MGGGFTPKLNTFRTQLISFRIQKISQTYLDGFTKYVCLVYKSYFQLLTDSPVVPTGQRSQVTFFAPVEH